ncbi:DUF2000 family protein [Phenylobacterium sp.]|uniref:DUF2000 family protein n=1 Tax=Phenylobacterium sp. TaxID=1871053 RepID=UPI0035B0EEEE
MFETKVVLVIREDLAGWQKLNVAAFLATGVAGAEPGRLGEPYPDAAGRRYAPLLGQPILVFRADLPALRATHVRALDRDLGRAAYVSAMFRTGHDAANRAAFAAEEADALDLVGLALWGPRKAVDKAVKGLALHD